MGASSFCSGFVINKERKLVMTADHCLETPLITTIDGGPTVEIFHDVSLDVAVLYAPFLKEDRVALEPAEERNLVYGEPVTFLGYTSEEYHAISGVVALRTIKVLDEEFGGDAGPFTLFRPEPLKGMSGGPILDATGKVVGINQLASKAFQFAMAHSIKSIVISVGNYWK